jgi:ribosomal protein S19E (S16A)
MNDKFIRDALIGEEWMALRQIASGGKAGGIPQSAQTKLASLGLIERDHYGRMTLTEKGRRMIETPE